MLFSNVTLRMALNKKYILANTGEFNLKSISKKFSIVAEFLTIFPSKRNKLELIPDARNLNADLRYDMTDSWYGMHHIKEYKNGYQLGPATDFIYYSFLVKYFRPEDNVTRICRIANNSAWFILFLCALFVTLKWSKMPQLETNLGKKIKKIGDFILKPTCFWGIATLFCTSITKANMSTYHVYQSSPKIYTLDDLVKEPSINVIIQDDSYINRYFQKHYKAFFDDYQAKGGFKKWKALKVPEHDIFKGEGNTAYVSWCETMRHHCTYYKYLGGVNFGEIFLLKSVSYLIPKNSSLEGREIFVQRLQSYMETGHYRRAQDLQYKKTCTQYDINKDKIIKNLTSNLASLSCVFGYLIFLYILSILLLLVEIGVNHINKPISLEYVNENLTPAENSNVYKHRPKSRDFFK